MRTELSSVIQTGDASAPGIHIHTVTGRLRNGIREPILYIVLFSLVLFSIGITWGLPHTETWCPDSLAPFHPLLGLSQLFSFGYFNKYPLVHQVILAVLNLPVLIAGIINSTDANGLDLFHFIPLILSRNYATALMVIDNLVSVVMGAGIVYLTYRCARLLFDKKAALYAALIVSLNAALNLHAHLAKVDVPYLFWAMLGLYYLIRVIQSDLRRDYILCAVMVCLSFGTKDQAYAIFVLPLTLYLLYYQWKYRYDGLRYRDYLTGRNFRAFALTFVIGTLIVENVLLNPTGFAARYRHLTGIGTTASINYNMDFNGITKLLYMTFSIIADSVMGAPFLLISIAGIGLVIYAYRRDRKTLLACLIFLVAAASYYIFFVQVARQNAYRFTIPLSVFISVYGGFFLGRLHDLSPRRVYRAGLAAAVAACAAASLYLTCSIDYNLLHDVRYRAEEWMSRSIPGRSSIEYYSYLHYLPRFPEGTVPYRIKEEIATVGKRKPDYIVLTSSYDYRFIGNPRMKLPKGFKVPEGMLKLQKEYSRFYADLFGEKLDYRVAAMFTHEPFIFKEMRLFRIVPHRIVIFKRTGAPGAGPGSGRTYRPSILVEE